MAVFKVTERCAPHGRLPVLHPGECQFCPTHACLVGRRAVKGRAIKKALIQ